MPYRGLVAPALPALRPRTADLDRHDTTIEEREEYEPHLDAGRIVYAAWTTSRSSGSGDGADVVVWTVGTTTSVLPGRTSSSSSRTRSAPGTSSASTRRGQRTDGRDVVVINKVDSATPEQVATVVASIRAMNPTAAVVKARSTLTLEGGEIAGRSVVVVEDGATLTTAG